MSSCSRISPLLSELVDGTLADDVRAGVEAHVDACGACRALVEDLTAMKRAARGLGEIAPPAHVWLELAGRMRLDAEPRSATGGPPAAAPIVGRTPAPRAALHQWIGLAAALVLVTLASYFVVRTTRETPPPQAASNATPSASVESLEHELQKAEQHFDNAIQTLMTMVKEGDASLDPVRAVTLQRTLPVIDSAIAESRAALKQEPESQPARASLFEALRKKISVLQDTVVLMNEMRQGNDAGAAEIAAGLGKKS